MAILGWKRALNAKDFWALNPEDSTSSLVPLWTERWMPAMDDYWRRKALAEAKRLQKVECRAVDDGEQVKIVSGREKARSEMKSLSEKRSGPSEPSVVWALTKMFKSTLISAALLKLIHNLLQFVNPLMIKFVHCSLFRLLFGASAL